MVFRPRATRLPLRNRGIDSRPLWHLRTRSRGESCIDRPSSARFLLALPPRVERHEAWAGSDQLEGTGGTRDPRRPKRLVVVTQGHRGRPAAGSRRKTPSYKFTSTLFIESALLALAACPRLRRRALDGVGTVLAAVRHDSRALVD